VENFAVVAVVAVVGGRSYTLREIIN